MKTLLALIGVCGLITSCSTKKDSNIASAHKGQETLVITECVRNWQERWDGAGTVLLVDTNISALIPNLSNRDNQSGRIHLAENGMLRAQILRRISNLMIVSNSASATLYIESTRPPMGRYAGTGEKVVLHSDTNNEWKVIDVKTAENDEFVVPGELQEKFKIPDPFLYK